MVLFGCAFYLLSRYWVVGTALIITSEMKSTIVRLRVCDIYILLVCLVFHRLAVTCYSSYRLRLLLVATMAERSEGSCDKYSTAVM